LKSKKQSKSEKAQEQASPCLKQGGADAREVPGMSPRIVDHLNDGGRDSASPLGGSRPGRVTAARIDFDDLALGRDLHAITCDPAQKPVARGGGYRGVVEIAEDEALEDLRPDLERRAPTTPSTSGSSSKSVS
jgi:hypothetical protein